MTDERVRNSDSALESENADDESGEEFGFCSGSGDDQDENDMVLDSWSRS